MESGIGKGYLVLVDISGFTPFVAGTELEHSQAILSDIFKLIMRRFTPRLTVAEIEGDAVFAYATDQQFPRGETLLEIIEATYVDFRDRQKSGKRLATCTCKACQMIGSLDLKFITHHGDFVFQDIAGRPKPLGSSVNLVHRLLKNKITENTGWRGYALFTEASLLQMDVHPLNIHSQIESYEHLGDVQTYSLNLGDRYIELTDERVVRLDSTSADVVVSKEFSATADVLWEWLNEPQKRSRWQQRSDWHADDRPQGRASRGATNHCSNSGVVERVLDWRPFSYYTVEFRKGPLRLMATTQLDMSESGTILTLFAKFNYKLPPFMRRPLSKLVVMKGMQYPSALAKLTQLLTDEEPALAVH